MPLTTRIRHISLSKRQQLGQTIPSYAFKPSSSTGGASGIRSRYHSNVELLRTASVPIRAIVAVATTLGIAACTVTHHELDNKESTNAAWYYKPLIMLSPFSGDDQVSDNSTSTTPKRLGRQAPPSQTRHHAHGDEVSKVGQSQSESTKQSSTDIFQSLKDQFTNFDFSNIGEQITGAIFPSWVKILPGLLRKLQAEMSMAPGSLAEEIWHEAHDPEANPEITWDANVRIDDGLCNEELFFREQRKEYTRSALARYLDVPEKDIHLDDVPVIAMCGSGGGLRALVAETSSYLSTQEAGLLDCVMYTAGVSGSCWLQSLFFSSIGRQDYGHMIEHLKHRLGVHIAFPPAALNLLSSAPTNKYLLSGIIEKVWGVPNADFGLVDVYGLLLAARLLVPKGDLSIDYNDLKVSDQSKYLDHGRHPLPIYTAVRHEIPKKAVEELSTAALKERAREEAWFQWFEWTPYEFFCEELEAGIPTWAIGRQFDQGKTVWRENGLALPELRMPVLMGIWGSAFCATLSHYYKEIRPIVTGLAGLGGVDSLLTEKDEDLIKVHPIDPATIPNFVKNMREALPRNCPESIHNSTHLQLMDAGMSNNLPIYPLLRPGRDVDLIITFDASADVVKDNWLKVTDGYVRQRGVKGWPVGSGWPTEQETARKVTEELEDAQASSATNAEQRLEQARQRSRPSKDAVSTSASNRADAPKSQNKPLGYCTVWVGTREERQSDGEPPLSKAVEQDWELMKPDAGLTVIYFPFLANPAVPGVDPQTSDFMSTWNFVYTPEEIDKVVNLARANFEAGKEQTKRTVRAIWQRKQAQRLEREKQEKESRWTLEVKKTIKRSRLSGHGDQFS